FLIAGALAHDNGMDMNMDQGMSMQMGNMITYLHFGLGDNLWFLGWAPKTAGAMFGTCFGLFMLAMAERWLTAMRGVMEGHWNMRAQTELTNKRNTPVVATPEECTDPSSNAAQHQLGPNSRWHQAPRFHFSHDVPRGIMHFILVIINVLFMLTFMTFQLGFIFAIIIGLGTGEAFFGRYSLQVNH
ncbi:Ctr copper transporter, partial [Russula brevipes]